MMQLDMTMYTGPAPIVISPMNDYTSPELNAFLHILIDTYCTLGYVDSPCGYACSDHASWHRTGVAAVKPAENVTGKRNANIHTARDTIDILSFEHGREFVALGLSHVVELANAPPS